MARRRRQNASFPLRRRAGPVIDILDARLLAQFGDAQPHPEALVLPPGRLAVDPLA